MQFTYDPNLYQLEDGRQLAQFVNVEPFDKRQLRNDPYPNSGPLVRWEFKIMTGVDAGKQAFILTPQNPSPKNACMRMITGITGQPMKENEQITLEPFKGRYYAVLIKDGKISHQFPPQSYGPNWNNAQTLWAAQHEMSNEPPEVPSDEPSGF